MSRNIPWARILAEGIAIVTSILLAFGIEAWWSERQNQEVVEAHLAAVKGELQANVRAIDHELVYRTAVLDSIEKLTSPELKVDSLTPSEVDVLLGHLTWYGLADVSLGALQSTLQTGVFAEINDPALQALLAALPAQYEQVQQFERRDADFTLNRFYPLLNEKGSLNQIINSETKTGRPGTNDAPYDYSFRVVEARDHSALLASDEFLGLLTMAHSNHSDVVFMYEGLRSRIEDSIAFIDRRSH